MNMKTAEADIAQILETLKRFKIIRWRGSKTE